MTPKCQKWKKLWTLYWNHFRWKSPGILCSVTVQTRNFVEFPHNWENWEYFANFKFRNFYTWYSDFWQNFKWNFGAKRILEFSDPMTPRGSLRSLNTRTCVTPKFHLKISQKSKYQVWKFLKSKLAKYSQFSQLRGNSTKFRVWIVNEHKIPGLFHLKWFQ